MMCGHHVLEHFVLRARIGLREVLAARVLVQGRIGGATVEEAHDEHNGDNHERYLEDQIPRASDEVKDYGNASQEQVRSLWLLLRSRFSRASCCLDCRWLWRHQPGRSCLTCPLSGL